MRWTGGALLGSVVVLTALVLSGCSARSSDPATQGRGNAEVAPGQGEQKVAAAQRAQVIASFYPLAEAVQRVGGDRVGVVNLTPAGAEPHFLDLKPSDLDRINQAALVVYLGKGFQPAVEKAAEKRGPAALDVLEGLPLQQGIEEEEDGPGRAEQPDAEPPTDPHVWLDPTLMGEVVSKVEGALIRVDPAGREAYAANAARYRQELQQLDAELRVGLANCERHAIVTSHAAFGYLSRRYGLQQEPIAGLSPDSEPKPGRLARLASQVRKEGTSTVFTETLVSPKVAETFAREAGLKTASLDPIEGLTGEELQAGKNYVTIMRDDLAALRPALGCR